MNERRIIRVGITGQTGFIGTRLTHLLGSCPEAFRVVPFSNRFFLSARSLEDFLENCDVVLHLAAVNRPMNSERLYKTNVELTGKLVCALHRTSSSPAVIFASSIREGEDTFYGQSKEDCRGMLEKWAKETGGRLLTLRIPNVFGPGAKPFDNSFIATFSYQIIHGLPSVVTENRMVPLIYIDSLCGYLCRIMGEMGWGDVFDTGCPVVKNVEPDFGMSVPEVLRMLEGFFCAHKAQGGVTEPDDKDRKNLLKTFLSYLE